MGMNRREFIQRVGAFGALVLGSCGVPLIPVEARARTQKKHGVGADAGVATKLDSTNHLHYARHSLTDLARTIPVVERYGGYLFTEAPQPDCMVRIHLRIPPSWSQYYIIREEILEETENATLLARLRAAPIRNGLIDVLESAYHPLRG